MAAIIFALPLVGEIVRPARLGLPPLPYGEEQGVFKPAHAPVTPPIFGSTGSTQVEETTIKSTSHLNSFPLLMSIAFAWAYVAERKKRGYATAGN